LNHKILKQLVAITVVGSIGYFFINRLTSSWDKLGQTSNFSLTAWSVCSVILMVLAVIASGWLWGKLLNEIEDDYQVSNIEAIRVHVGAWLLKYIPGQIGSVVYKISWGRKHGIAKSKTGWSFVYENLFLAIASTFIPAIILIAAGGLHHALNYILSATVAVLVLAFTNKKLLLMLVNLLSARIKFIKTMIILDRSTITRFSTIYLIPRFINGLAFVFVAASLFGVSVGNIAPLIAAYTLAGIVGIYAIFVPSGLGVREGMIVVLTAGIYSVEQAALLALVARFYATISDGILALIYIKFTKERIGYIK
jgi:uncharacterized membrane protein YbhN (UPF0104 family)